MTKVSLLRDRGYESCRASAAKMPTDMIVRIQSPEYGTRRIHSSASEKINIFLDKIKKEFQLNDTGWEIYKDRKKGELIRTTRAKCLSDYNICHGDMLFLFPETNIGYKKLSEESPLASTSSQSPGPVDNGSSSSSTGAFAAHKANNNVVLDAVDQILEKEDGKVKRKRNEQLCRHGPQGKCLHCAALEPYDEEVLKECNPPIKFLSFHSYLRKLTGGVDKGKFANLEDISCKIKSGCNEHPPWPGGICTKCQPNAVTLNRQTYRHVDNIMFENPKIAERFLNYWRRTGRQRLGILYGHYEVHKDVPLGIKATIAAIYEPPQESSRNRIKLLDDDKEDLVNNVAEQLGLCPIGWIFTDLIADDLKKATVKHFRGNSDSHFLSAEECIMAAEFQNKYPNPCRYSKEGKFGSKFVTVVVTGDNKNQVHFEGYQVSNQCMALVRDDCLIPTKDAPELGYVKESTSEQFVPDVFYKVKDKYGNEVTELARPLPVEYLLVDIPCAFPVNPIYTFSDSNHKNFPVENRESLGEIQDFNALTQYMEEYSPTQFLEAMSDFHLLLFLASCDMLPLKATISTLFEAIKAKNEEIALQFKKSEEWATVEMMMAPHENDSNSSTRGAEASTGTQSFGAESNLWTCVHCTFINHPSKVVCEMCSLPQ